MLDVFVSYGGEFRSVEYPFIPMGPHHDMLNLCDHFKANIFTLLVTIQPENCVMTALCLVSEESRHLQLRRCIFLFRGASEQLHL